MNNLIIYLISKLKIIGPKVIKLLIELEKLGTKSKLITIGSSRNLYKTRFGDLFWLNKISYVDKCIIDYGLFEIESTNVVKKLVKPGDIILDIGANIGYYTVMMSKIVKEHGKIYAFEPTEYFRSVLNANIEVNKINNVEVFDVGLSNNNISLNINIGESSATLHSPCKESTDNVELIKMTSLDEFVMDHNLPKIDFIKIDIDGHEPLFFEGAWNTLEKFDPVILLEISHIHYLAAGYTAWDFYELLKQKHYYIYHENDLAEISSKEEFLIRCANFAYSANIIISRKKLRVN